MMWKPEKIISGGQTGADIGGLVGAEKIGVPTGGYAPRNYKTEEGNQPILKKRFGLISHPSPDYRHRTEENVKSSDAIIIYSANNNSTGTQLTINLCIKHTKPYCVLNPYWPNAIDVSKTFLNEVQPSILNIAGNRESVSPGIAQRVAYLIQQIYRNC